MKNAVKWSASAVSGVAMSLAMMGPAVASDAAIYDWPDEDIAVVLENESGIFMIDGEEGAPTRAFSWRENDGEHDKGRRFVDMTGDGMPEIVGSGTPTFLTDSGGEPLVSREDGCQQVWLADIAGRTDLDMVCVTSDRVRVYTGQGRSGPSIGLGQNLDWCRAGDITQDTTNDLECKLAGRNQFARMEYTGDVFEVLNSSADSARLEDVEESIDAWPAVDESVWTGGESFDLSGDGSASETLHFEESTLEIRSEGEEEPLFGLDVQGSAQAAIVKDLNDDGDVQIVALSDERIYVIGEAGEEVADFSANAGSYNRVPRAYYRSVNVNGFDDNDAVRDLVKDVKDQIGSCYGSRLQSAPFAGSGRHVVRVMIGDDGSVDQVQQRHSDIRDDAIESCANDALEGINYPAAEARGMVNVNVIFTFVDEEG